MQNLEDIYQLRALFQGMTEALIVYDENGKIIRFNEAALRIFSVTPSELLNLTTFDLKFRPIKEDLTPIDDQSNPMLLARKTGVPKLNFVIGIYRKNEELRWLSLNAVPIFFEQQKLPRQTMVTFKDITDEKIAREKLVHLQYELAEREKFLSTILNSLPLLVSYVDKNLDYQYVNSTYEEWFRIGKHDVVGKPIKDILGEKAFEIIKPKIVGAQSGQIQSFTSKIPYQGAGERNVEVHYIPDITPDGFKGFFSIVNDITAQVSISKQIEKHEKELEQILNAIPALVGHWDKDLINIHANRSYSDYFGKHPDWIKGKHIKALLGPKLFSENLPYLEKVLAGETQVFEREIPLPNGGSKHTLAQYLPEIIDQKVVGFFVIVTDVTPIKELLKKEQISREKAEHATILRDEMIAVVSHDLRNPLSIIVTSSDILLSRMKQDDPLLKNAARIKKSIHDNVEHAH